MKDYIQRLVARLADAEKPLSRNRHFHTFDNPHGRRALRIARQLRSLARDIVDQAREGHPIRVEHVRAPDGNAVRVLVHFDRLRAQRTAYLSPAEYELLLQTEAVRAVVTAADR